MRDLRSFWRQSAPYLVFVVSLTATLGSLYYSEVRHFVPCTLCWYQRICMYPIPALALVGILRGDDNLAGYVLPLSTVGLGIAVYHNLIQYGAIAESAVCQAGVPCDVPWVNYMGFVTIPLMSLVAFVLITGVLLAALFATGRLARRDADSSTGD